METELGSELSENMCGECEMRANFASLFRRKASFNPERKWTLPALMTAARECRFCSLVLKVVSINNMFKNLKSESTVCSMTIEDFGFTQCEPYDPDTVKRVSRLWFDLKVRGEDQKSSHNDHIQPSYPAFSSKYIGKEQRFDVLWSTHWPDTDGYNSHFGLALPLRS